MASLFKKSKCIGHKLKNVFEKQSTTFPVWQPILFHAINKERKQSTNEQDKKNKHKRKSTSISHVQFLTKLCFACVYAICLLWLHFT